MMILNVYSHLIEMYPFIMFRQLSFHFQWVVSGILYITITVEMGRTNYHAVCVNAMCVKNNNSDSNTIWAYVGPMLV